MRKVLGHCFCKKVKYEIQLDQARALDINCEKLRCIRNGQRLIEVDKSDFSLIDGAESLTIFNPEGSEIKQLFCSNCGQFTHLRWLTGDKIGLNRCLFESQDIEHLLQDAEEVECGLCS
jgi:hypothetical protein